MKTRGLLQDGVALHFSASVVAAFLSSTFSCPADFIMTRYQTAPVLGGTGKTGLVKYVVELVQAEGILSLYRGWTPLFARVAPVYVIYLPLYEQFRKMLGLGYMQ